MRVTKIISGGQTGADIAGLKAAVLLGIPTGGFAAKGYRTENGLNPELGTLYGLVDTGVYNYLHRTELNVHRSDGTVLFGRVGETGTGRTKQYCKKHHKPWIHITDLALHYETSDDP